MDITTAHARFLAEASARLLGQPHQGDVVFARCLAPEVVRSLAAMRDVFVVPGWETTRRCG
jgi:hypothetical protein